MQPAQPAASARERLFVSAARVAKRLHRTDERWRSAAEAGVIGLLLMIGLSLFGGAPSSPPSQPYTAPVSSYAPAAPAVPAQPPPPPSGNPTLSLQQLQQIRQQSGGGNVLSTLPIKVAPAIKAEDIRVEENKDATKDEFGTFRGKKKEMKPSDPDGQ